MGSTLSLRGAPALAFLAHLCLVAFLSGGCGGPPATGSAEMPIHLEERLDVAEVDGAEIHSDLVAPLRWSFADGSAGWRALPAHVEGARPAEIEEAGGALRVRLSEANVAPADADEDLYGGIYLDLSDHLPQGLDDFDLADWRQVEIEARATGSLRWVGIGYNVRRTPGPTPDEQWSTEFYGSGTFARSDGEVHVFRTGVVGEGGPVTEPVRQVAIEVGASGPAEIEILSISLEPASAVYGESGVGVRSVSSNVHEDFGPQRRAIYAHAPSRLSFPLRVPADGRLDLALGALGGETRMSVRVDAGDGEGEDATSVLLEETVAPSAAWLQRSVDLSRWSGRDVTLGLDATADEAAVAFWASPTVSSASSTNADRPNVVFYVIDGASADLMSVYGYDRPTTPNLERIAAEGVVFEQAHSNSTWTMPSTASFMTSLHHSVLGGLKRDANPVPPDVETMAEHFHDAGFHTGVFTFNPNAGALSGLDRAVDVFRDFGKRGAPLDPIEAISSQVLHEQYWQWREAYPGPYWVHFQTTDVHPPHHPQDPFAGRFVPKEKSAALAKEMLRFRFPFNHDSASVHEHWQEQLAEKGVDSRDFYGTMRDAHDEAMLHQDHRLGELVERLKARGEWENTLLVIGSDHGHPAASYPRFGRGLLDPQPPAWEGALFGQFPSHVPLIFVWSGTIEGGRRIESPVSMIDVLPTILDLAGLPQPEIAQGRSLAPLLAPLRHGEAGWEERPVVFDEFRVAEDGSMIGNLEIRDGRWGRSLEIRTADSTEPPSTGRHPAPAGGRWKALPFDDVPRLLIYDLEADPRAIRHVADPDPQLVEEAERRLWRLWEEHRALAAQFEEGEEAELSPEQLEALQALGYVE